MLPIFEHDEDTEIEKFEGFQNYQDFLSCLKVFFPGLFSYYYEWMWDEMRALQKEGYEPLEIIYRWNAAVRERAYVWLQGFCEYDDEVGKAIDACNSELRRKQATAGA